MKRPAIILSNLVVICLEKLIIASCLGIILCGQAIDSPQYKVIHSESDFEVRLYKESIWMSAFLQGTTSSFENSTKDGFHRLYKYIHGANRNSSEFPMTAPVLTSIIVSSSSSKQYYVKYYVPVKFGRATPQPFPELNLKLEKWTSHCLAVRKFSGFANDDNVNKEVETLTNSLNKHYLTKKEKRTLADDKSYAIAQYNASHHLSGRLNEVWMNVTGFSSKGCVPNM